MVINGIIKIVGDNMIPKEYQFDTFEEFYIKRDNISIWFDTLDTDHRWKYKYYIFSRPRLKGVESDLIDIIYDWLMFQIEDSKLDKAYEIWRFFNES